MSQTRNSVHASFQASGTIPAYTCVGPATTTTANLVSVWATATSQFIGISADLFEPTVGADIIIGGTAKGLLAASVAVWRPVTAQTATGQLIEDTDTAATVTTLFIPFQVGLALGGGSVGSVIEVLIRPINFRFDF